MKIEDGDNVKLISLEMQEDDMHERLFDVLLNMEDCPFTSRYELATAMLEALTGEEK